MAVIVKKFQALNWHILTSCDPLPIGQTTFVSGPNQSGKSALLDALQFLFFVTTTGFNAGNEASNKQGKRDITSYVRAKLTMTDDEDDKNNYLRTKPTNTHVVAECENTETGVVFVIGVTAEAKDITDTLKPAVTWWSAVNCHLDDLQFTVFHETKKGFRYATLAEIMQLTPAGRLIKKYSTREEAKRAFSSKQFFYLTDNNFGDIEVFDRWVRTQKNAIAYSPKNIDNLDAFIKKYVLPTLDVDTKDFLELIEEQQRLDEILDEQLRRSSQLKIILDKAEDYRKGRQSIKSLDVALNLLQIKNYERQIEAADQKYEQKNAELAKLQQQNGQLLEEIGATQQTLAALEAKDQSAAMQAMRRNLARDEEEIGLLEEQKVSFNRNISAVRSFATKANHFFGSKIIPTDFLDLYQDSPENPVDNQDYLFQQLTAKLKEISDFLADKNSKLEYERKSLKAELDETTVFLQMLRKSLGAIGAPDRDVTKRAIQEEFEAQGINDKPYYLCELLEYKYPEWAAAAEAYMGISRFSIFVSPENYKCAAAVSKRIRDEGKSYGIPIVDTPSFSASDITAEPDTLASVFTAKNRFAKEYVNYVYGNVHLVEDAALPATRDGVSIDQLCNRYSRRSFITMRKVDPVIGQQARIRQKEHYERMHQKLSDELHHSTQDITLCRNLRETRQKLSGFIENGFACLLSLNQLGTRKKSFAANHKKYLAFLDRPEQMQAKTLTAKLQALKKEQNTLADRITDTKALLNGIGDEQTKAQQLLETYEAEKSKIADADAISQAEAEIFARMKKTRKGFATMISELSDERQIIIDSLSDLNGDIKSAQTLYKEKFTADYEALGFVSMDAYLEDYENLMSVDVPNTKIKAERNRLQTQQYFQDTVVCNLKTNIQKANEILSQINRAMEKMVFNGKFYRFGDILPAEKYRQFYKMITNHTNVGVQNNQLSFDSMSFDDEFSAERAELFDAIAAFSTKKDAEKPPLLDYRTYCKFRLFECNADNPNKKADLDASLGFGSGSEVQIPCYIVLVAALAQMYGRGNRLNRNLQNSNSIRLILVDECFEKMDYSNANQMVRFTANMGLQMIAAAPSEKFSSFGEDVDSVIFVYVEKKNGNDIRRCQYFSSYGDYIKAWNEANGIIDAEEIKTDPYAIESGNDRLGGGFQP